MKFSLVGQTIVDTTIYFHSKYNTILEGMICKYYFFSDYDYEKYKENRKGNKKIIIIDVREN